MAQPYQLPPELEVVWEAMQALLAHPFYHDALMTLPNDATRERYHALLNIPRIWLADQRADQVNEVMIRLQAAIDTF